MASYSYRRWLALMLVRHGIRLLPDERSTWAVAMREEVRAIADDREALHWAVGCARSAYMEWLARLAPLKFRAVRWSLAGWIGLQAIGSAFDGLLVLSYRWRALGLTQFLGLRTEGDDYHRYIPLMSTVPLWVSVLSVLLGALYGAAGVQLLRGRRSAAALFIAALMSALALWIHDLTNPLYMGSFSALHLCRDTLLYLISALLAIGLWRGRGSLQRPARHSRH